MLESGPDIVFNLVKLCLRSQKVSLANRKWHRCRVSMGIEVIPGL